MFRAWPDGVGAGQTAAQPVSLMDTCNTMGSASSFAAVSEALGVALKYNATIPAVDANRQAMAHATGRRIVALVREDKRLSHYLTREAFENAIKVHAAIGGSTNSVLHLLALAGRVGVPLTLDDFDRLGGDMPLLANIMPSGEYLMEDLHYAGGMPALMSAMAEYLNLDVETVSGQTIGDQIAGAEIFNPAVIGTLGSPVPSPARRCLSKGRVNSAAPRLSRIHTRPAFRPLLQRVQAQALARLPPAEACPRLCGSRSVLPSK